MSETKGSVVCPKCGHGFPIEIDDEGKPKCGELRCPECGLEGTILGVTVDEIRIPSDDLLDVLLKGITEKVAGAAGHKDNLRKLIAELAKDVDNKGQPEPNHSVVPCPNIAEQIMEVAKDGAEIYDRKQVVDELIETIPPLMDALRRVSIEAIGQGNFQPLSDAVQARRLVQDRGFRIVGSYLLEFAYRAGLAHAEKAMLEKMAKQD